MKFRRGIAKLLVAVTIVELVLSSINRSEYVVLAATDETTQSEMVVETESQDEAERTLADTMGVIAESIDTEDAESQSEEMTVGESEEEAESGEEETESGEEETETSESDTTGNEGETENSEASTEENLTGETTENTEEGTTEESSENTESSIGDTTESTREEIAENTESNTAEGNTEENTTEENSEKTTEDTTEDISSESSDATEEDTEASSENTTETKDASGKVSEKDTQNSIMDTVREAMEEMDSDEPQAVGTVDLGESVIPTTLNDLSTSTTKSYYIKSYQDWLNLQALSQVADLAGYTFTIGTRDGKIEFYNFEEVIDEEGDYLFTGIGSETHPFKGKITRDFNTGIPLQTNCALFKYLSTDAELEKLTIEPHGACAGLAENLQVDGNEFKTLQDIDIDAGTGIKDSEVAGGLFANVVNKSNIQWVLKGTNVKVNASVTGGIAGGLIGSMTGSVILYMDGGIQCATEVEAYVSKTSTTGGWIGSINADDGNIIIRADEGKEIAYTFQGKRNATAGVAGGLFGTVLNAKIIIKNKLRINNNLEGDMSSNYDDGFDEYDLSGITVGAFAGEMTGCTLNLEKEVAIDKIRIAQYNSSSVTTKGVGGFVGVIQNSTLDSNVADGILTISDVWVVNEETNANVATLAHNIGGIAGYAYNTYFTFTNGECTIKDFSSRLTYGNVAGAIGLYEADEDMGQIGNTVIQRISVTGTTTAVSIKGAAAGLIGRMKLVDCIVKVQDCRGENLCFAGGKNSDNTKVSMGIGIVSSEESSAKLYLTGIVLKGNLTQCSDNDTYKETFGGMIGYADIDLEIAGKYDETEVFDTAVCYAIPDTQQTANCFGGLIGAVCQSGTEYRKVDISNVLIGASTYYGCWRKTTSVYGGMLGRVEDRTSVCLDGKIYLNSGTVCDWKKETISIGAQIPIVGNSAFGSVVGYQNYSLIYLQPTGKLKTSQKNELNEIGNYGGIFRNGNWDDGSYVNEKWVPSDQNANKDNWLIQDHEVTGAWKYIAWDNSDNKDCAKIQIQTLGDFMRLAIFGNTCNLANGNGTTTTYQWGDGFYTLDVVDSNGDFLDEDRRTRDKVFSTVFTADFYLEPQIYDLRETGIVSLYRNDLVGSDGIQDNEGNTRAPSGLSRNSLICESKEKATIIYAITDYSQANIGLFPGVYGDSKIVEFENLNLKYTFELKLIKYGDTSADRELDKSGKQNIGGLAAKAYDNVKVSNVSYTGTIKDEKYSISSERYTGGLFSWYRGFNSSSKSTKLDISDLEAAFSCTYKHWNNVVGAVVARVYTNDVYRCEVSMERIKVSGEIAAYYDNNSVELMQSGLITAVTCEDNKGIYSNFNISDVSITDLSLGVTDSKLSVEYPAIGGFLGYSWNCVKVNLSNIKIGTDSDAKGASISAKVQCFGGLVRDASGKILIDGMEYGDNTSFDLHEDGNYSGLLVQYAPYLYLDVADYSVGKVSVKNYTGTYFDELVGYNKGGDSYEKGGIVSIRRNNSSYLGKGGVSYDSYGYGYHVIDENGNFLQKKNGYTRYYYDLDALDYSIDYTTINSPEALMVWHLMHYANAYIVDQCLKTNGQGAYYASDAIPNNYTISGTINMTEYSIYPTTLFQKESYNAAGAVIIFNAQAIYDGENELHRDNSNFVVKYPEDYESQHYQMHAGLFNNIWSGVDVTGLTLQGTYSLDNYYGSGMYTAGALVCGCIYGVELEEKGSQGQTLYDDEIKSNFNDIVLSGLWCVSDKGRLTSSSESTDTISLYNPIGLMIANISSGAKVNLDGVKMTGYSNTDVESAYKAACALIGMVGNEEATYISLTFKNMDIMDAGDGKSSSELKSTKCEEALGKASFIYYYNYKENCSAIYTFTSKDYLVGKLGVEVTDDYKYEDDGFITLGEELGNQTYDGEQYAEILYYDNEDPVGMISKWLMEDGTVKTIGDVTNINFNCYNYLPYVCYNVQDILVNPKIADIEKGCGTYEDPYIISTTTQLITLYRYLYEEDTYKDVLGMTGNEWNIHATGNDSYRCDKTEDSKTGHGELLRYTLDGSEEFPTKEELSQAYYVISADLDLSKYTEFIGFGREELPFIGVFVGGEKTDGDCPTIQMLEASNSTLSQYAFIQVAKGVVVKNLTFSFDSTIKIDSENGGIAAGVIATVVGGDNIIENVRVTVSENANSCFEVEKETAVVGGYVGVVELGGVILRGMDRYSLSGFAVDTTASDSCPYIGSVVGKVLDGYVVYDGNSSEDEPLFQKTAVGKKLAEGDLVLCGTYDILNGAYLKSTESSIIWTGTGYQIADNKQLQIISMALNSGMFNYGATDSNGDSYGYASDSRQRYGDYNYVGEDIEYNNMAISAYYDVVAKDNATEFKGSYLWQYFTDSSSDKNMLEQANSNGLNPLTVTESTILTYELTGTQYDMSVFEMAFRGLGARYHCTDYVETWNKIYLEDTTLLFKSNLMGTNSEGSAEINMDMNVTEAMDSRRAGLLNEVPNTNINTGSNTEILIQNITLSGNVVNRGLKIKENSWGGYYIADVSYNAGGFMSDTINNLSFKNVSLVNLTVDATGIAGGMIGHVKECDASAFKAQDITLNHLTVAGGWDSKEEGIAYGHAGGLIGKFQSFGNRGSNNEGISPIYIGTDGEDFENIKGVTGDDVTVYTRGILSAAAGIVGNIVDTSYNYFYFANSTMTNLTVYTENAYTYYYERSQGVGGIVGYGYQARLNLHNVTIGSENKDDSVLIALKNDNLGENFVSLNLYLSAAGGLIGENYANGSASIKVENCKVLGVSDGFGNSTTQIQGYNNAGGIIGHVDAGTVSNSTVEGVSIKGTCNTGGCAGLVDGSDAITFTLENVMVSQCGFIANDPIAGKGTVSGSGVSSNYGYIGGLIGCLDNGKKVYIVSGTVSNDIISSENSYVAGGFIGETRGKVSVTGENVITQNLICGDTAGGVFGEFGNSSYNATVLNGISDIKISDNRIMSMMQSTLIPEDNNNRKRLAGGFAGRIETAEDVGPIEKIIIEDNLIAGSSSAETDVCAGGVVGLSYANTYFYDVQLRDNYIGFITSTDLAYKAGSYWGVMNPLNSSEEELTEEIYYLKNADLDFFKDLLYLRTDSSTQDVSKLSLLKDKGEFAESDYYKCSYGFGAVAGRVSGSVNRCNTLVNVNIQYSDNTYRPLFDVGMNVGVSNNESVYACYRNQYDIVYDSMSKENADNSENSNDTVANSGYKGFSNLDLIYNNYKTMTNADRRYAYRLDKSYLEGAYADSDKINIENIYQATYKNENGYISDFVTNDNKTIPLVVFRSTENGSLDEVIQTYVNMLTNNSGALNTYSNQEIVVTTQKKVLSNGVIYDGEGQAAVQVVELGNNKYQFENKAEDGTNLYDQMTDAQNVTFSLISISYNYNGNQKWKLQIPVYVEQELEFDSHMRLVKGIEYNVDTVKKGAYYNENSKDLTTIDRGESYTLYLEYVYGEARVRYTNATIPKQLSMEYVGDSNEVSFLKNTQFTLIDLKNGGKPYYYVADGSDGSILDFENFKDSAGNPYTARNINECAEYPDTFTDVCGFEKQNVAVENYLLLVDTSQVEKAERETRGNVIYTLKTDISELETKNERLYSQLEYTDHCSVRVQEIIGVSCSFSDEDVFSEQLEGAITEGGSVALPLQYNVTITNAWKNTNSSTPVYLDIAVSLQKKANNTTQTVALPVGTQVYFEMLNEDSNTYTRSDTGYTVQGNGISDVYYYADSNSEIKLTDFDPDKQFTKTIRIILDFSMADMSSFENVGNDAEYGIAADLLISTDQENPGNGEVRDSVYRTVKVDVSSELGFALQPNDLITLGINRYQSGDTDTGIMPFAAKIAFPEDYTQDDVKGKYYSIVYKLEEKTTRQDGISAPLYKLYTGNGVKLYQGTEVNDSKDLAFNWSEDHSVRYYYCSLAGTDLDISKSIATIDFVLSAGEDMDYTNYRITGYLIISDSELSNPVSAIQDNSDLNSDFFVYTIANIKTDLN